ncbi:GNAT family N-acetyltransferase [Limosilactobacillus sp. c9Ua_26_M]|uniref:GNAT family N-acetyltransferase n=1 Tax=Limosilactobacillus urinaemulieris TaxID=2742600 RepID=A0ABR8ZLW3_9LACO|nr:GNAT family N-acetyltransferase [Limosilactobacillus urinaemulieris]MBD8086299.1 GNAT family N-acetyltransferase [Limosilactobacillus urinaemulieris]
MKLDQVRVAQLSDLKGVATLYKTVCDHQQLDKYGANWTWGEYPSVDGLRNFIQQATVVVRIKEDRVVAAGVMTTGEEYPDVDWPTKVSEREIGIWHLIAVHPDYRRTGVSRQLLDGLFDEARREGKKVIHLDILADNLPSEKLYSKIGFRIIKELIIHYDDIGDQQAKVMEYQL